ncbi:uncharacterized protein LOC129592005 [Paramacrobiotus metropolitanus]|uniref:uncharacterized protein LOC129592005 n=1 Tax=Paramacrobiotus metropolitanus TaxID=2943436 RepID=UPI00244599E8|nr:uncharacterized protein LOC129592005 [Paramacrobiotus metropolitanus]
MESFKVTAEDILTFEQDGAVCLRNVFSPEWVRKVESGIAKNLKHPSGYSEFLKDSSTSPIVIYNEGIYFNDYFNWKNIPEFQDYVYHSPAADVVQQLLKTATVTFYHEHVLIKEQGAAKETPWHHDQSYYPFDGEQACSIWMPVDPVALPTTLQFIRGSHKWGWFYPRKFATTLNYSLTSTVLDHEYRDVPDIANIPESEILQWTLQPGDCIVFHMKTLHGAKGNMTANNRRILSTRWFGDDVRMAQRPWVPSPPVTGKLKVGDPPNTDPDLFPVVKPI